MVLRAAGSKFVVGLQNDLALCNLCFNHRIAGKVEFRVDKTGIIHCPVGKVSFDAEKLADNANALISSVLKAKPATAKGRYVRSVAISSTMGPGFTIDLASLESA